VVAVRRRQVLAAGVAAAVLPLLAWSRSAGVEFSLGRRWPGGNRTPAPFALSGETLYANGEAVAEGWDVAQGKLRWRHPLASAAVFRPRLSAGLVVTAGRFSLDARGVADGLPRWSIKPEQELGVPLVHDGRVFVGDGNRLLALDADTGARLWAFETEGSSRIAYAPAGGAGRIYLGPGDGRLYALDASSGKPVWQVDRGGRWQYLRQLQIAGDLLVAGGYHDEIYGIEITDGAVAWRFDAGNFVNSQLVHEGGVYFWSPTGWLYALDVRTGLARWRHRTSDFRGHIRSADWAPVMAELAAHDGELIVLAMDHVLHRLDLKTGDEIARHPMPVPLRPFVTLDARRNSLWAASVEGEVIELRLR